MFNKKFIRVIAITSMCGSLFLTGCFGSNQQAQTPTNQIEETQKNFNEDKGYSYTTGEKIDKQSYPILVSHPNDSSARPHLGLSKADVIYEGYIEGNGTRLLALYSNNQPTKVEPIRSGRIWMVDLVKDWNAGFAYFGGPYAGDAVDIEKKLKASNVKYTVNGLEDEKYMKRDSGRKAPNNAYFTLADYVKTIDQPAKRVNVFKFTGNAGSKGSDVSAITIPYTTANTVNYAYDSSSKTYKRSIKTTPFIDGENKQQIAPTNVILQECKQVTFENSVKSQIIEIVGSGKATYFVGGKMVVGSWSKKSQTDQTVYKDDQGNIMEFLPGKTFVQLVNNKMAIQTK